MQLWLALFVGNALVISPLRSAIDRPGPATVLDSVHLLGPIPTTSSCPAASSAGWLILVTVLFLYFRSSWRLTLPAALLSGLAQVYRGVHFPSDIILGAALGVGTGLSVVLSSESFWRGWAKRWFPLWQARLPSLLAPPESLVPARPETTEEQIQGQWLRLSYLTIALLFIGRLFYLASGTIQLSEDEAYQWVWSKHLALSYYSKPLLIAVTQFLGTSIWGDTAFGVRFFSPLISALLGLLIVRFSRQVANARVGFWLVLISATTPLLAVGSTLMTIDPLSVFFWAAAMMSGWRAVKEDSTSLWLWTGLWMGFGFLSKYVSVVQLLSWAVFFILWKPARRQLARPGPYLALLVNALCTLPVVIWNAQNGWITAIHLHERGGLDEAWRLNYRWLGDFVGAEFGLLNPVFFVGAVWAAWAVIRRHRHRELFVYLFSMGAPLFLFYLLWTARSRVLPNWIAPSVVPLFVLMVIYWEERWRDGATWVKSWLVVGLGFGLVFVTLLHNTDLIQSATGYALPAKIDPLRRARGWSETASLVEKARQNLAQQDPEAFIIGDHYGITGILSFYHPQAKTVVQSDRPIVYYRSSDVPDNQFFFWPGYTNRSGGSAIYVQETDELRPAHPRILEEFETVKDLGMIEVPYRGRVLHRYQLFECRNLR